MMQYRNLNAIKPVYIVVAAMFLSGCQSIWPDYQRPEVNVPAQYVEAGQQDAAETSVANNWWTFYQDQVLNELVEKYQNHPDIVFLSVTFDKDKKVKNLLKKQPFLYEHITHQGHGSNLIELLDVSIFPTHMLIAPDGIVEMRDMGEQAIDLIDSFLKNLE